MPVKIQEVIIQTKLKAANNTPESVSPKGNSNRESQKFEQKLRFMCREAMENLLQEKQQR